MANFQVPVHLYMSSPARTIPENASLEEAYERMMSAGISSLPVVDANDRLSGLISRSDLLRVGQRESGSRADGVTLTLPDHTVSDEMTREVRTVSPGDPLDEAARRMVSDRIHRVIVVEDGQVRGVLSTRDLMRAIREKEMNVPLGEYMSTPVFTIRAEEPLAMAVERLGKARISGLVVVEDGWPVGVFTQVEALEARDVRRSTPVGDVMSPRILTLLPDTRLYRAAAQAAATNVRRVVVQDAGKLAGILSGLDFARAVR